MNTYTKCKICKTIRKYEVSYKELLSYDGRFSTIYRSKMCSSNCCSTIVIKKYEKELKGKELEIIKLLYEK